MATNTSSTTCDCRDGGARTRRTRCARSRTAERLVHEVHGQVAEHAFAAVPGARLRPPRLRHRAPTLVARLVAMDVAEGALAHELLQREDLVVPAPILERDRELAVPLRLSGEVARLGGRRRERLVHHHVRALRRARRARYGACVACGVETTTRSSGGVIDQHASGVSTMVAFGIARRRLLHALRLARRDRRELESRRRRDERRVKGRAAEPVADERRRAAAARASCRASSVPGPATSGRRSRSRLATHRHT